MKDRQFCDYGNRYRTAIFVHNAERRKLAEASKMQVEAEPNVPIDTQIVNAGLFYKAEAYDHDFYKKSPLEIRILSRDCGRNRRIKQIWGGHKGDS